MSNEIPGPHPVCCPGCEGGLVSYEGSTILQNNLGTDIVLSEYRCPYGNCNVGTFYIEVNGKETTS